MFVDSDPLPISTIARFNYLNPLTLEKQYKDHLSDFREWEKSNSSDWLVFENNFSKRMSIDEISLSMWELYTVITSKEKHWKKWCLAAIIKWTKNEVVSRQLEKVPFEKILQVKEITVDLANSMDWICRTNFMWASLTADRFHVQQIISEAVQELRIEERRKVINEENQRNLKNRWKSRKEKENSKEVVLKNWDTKRQLLARSRYSLFKPSSKWTNSQKERMIILFELYPQIHKAYGLSMYFRNVYENSKTIKEARIWLQKWYQRVTDYWISQLISASETIKVNEWKILGYFENRETNAWAESFNAKIKWFRALVRWVRDTKFFLYRLQKLYA